jgi:hypothetical protein
MMQPFDCNRPLQVHFTNHLQLYNARTATPAATTNPAALAASACAPPVWVGDGGAGVEATGAYELVTGAMEEKDDEKP